MTITYTNVVTWLKQAVSLLLLAAVAVTALKLLGFAVPGVRTIPLTQDAGIAVAAMVFAVWKA